MIIKEKKSVLRIMYSWGIFVNGGVFSVEFDGNWVLVLIVKFYMCIVEFVVILVVFCLIYLVLFCVLWFRVVVN